MYLDLLVSWCSSVWGGVDDGTQPFVAPAEPGTCLVTDTFTHKTVYRGRLPGSNAKQASLLLPPLRRLFVPSRRL